MKSFLATTAIVLVLGGSAYAAPAQFNTYQSTANDIQASDFIGQTVYSSKTDVSADQPVAAGAEKDWDNIGKINDVVLGHDGNVKAVVLGVGGFLGLGAKNVALSMNDIKFVKNGDGADDYFLVINSTREALDTAPAYMTPADVKAAENAANTANTTDTAAAPGLTTPADTASDQASSTATTTDNTADTAANTDMAKPADTVNDQASSTMAKPADNAADTAADTTSDTDTQTTASTKTDSAVQSTIDEARARLARPDVTREGYQTAEATELTADKLEGAHVYGPKDEDVGEINRLVMSDAGKVKFVVLDVGGFLGMGEHQIAVTPDELNIVRNTKGDDVRVYIDANKDALKAQPEYKGNE